MNISMSFSPEWAEYGKVTLYSLMQTNQVDKVYLVTDYEPKGFPDSCIHINPAEVLRKYITTQINFNCREKTYCFYKLILPRLINDDKVLHIDTDALVIGDISEYYNTDLTGYIMAGVEDIGLARGYKQKIGLAPDDTYINAGIILFNLPELDKVFDKLIERVNTTWYLGNEQCILNVTSKGKIRTVDNRFNASLSTGYPADIRIMHYAGPKPWNVASKYSSVWQDWRQAYVQR